ncbi:hypothetical protein CkaCkLH20_11318 [Colletotrichum karsti]|uniref:Uncharacterized protein n=1 Tax=Colletotrichum karsti TaxID=1095194 RepID=A0A9P6HVJ3_9PEZI|nr:uncharacterized protein CkaCkLH20_11318 [Colletotrichum karsti]KAF9871149.1 hypothetical protein CkaCkLH20_11318 [Colletotrichum karsti]
MSAPIPRRRIIVSNLPLALEGHAENTEPAVEVLSEPLETEEMFDGMIQRTPVGTVPSVPTNFEGTGLPKIEIVPGSGIVLPGGINVYFLDLAPGCDTPMHRTPSVDYIAIISGTPTLLTPKRAFKVEDGKGTWDEVVETVLGPGDVAVQRGAMHAWTNRSDAWVRMVGIIVDAKPSKVKVGENFQELGEKWYLGIDFGSTSTRAFLYSPTQSPEKQRNVVENYDGRSLRTAHRFERGDFSSMGYPFEPGLPVYQGESLDLHRQAVSLKYAIYALTRHNDDLYSQYSLVQPIWNASGDEEFKERLREGLTDLFIAVKEKVDKLCKSKDLNIKRIAITVPAQWTGTGQCLAEEYESIVSRVFDAPGREIVFVTETEALAHYLLRDEKNLVSTGEPRFTLLFMDFGGHNMNGSIFNEVNGPREANGEEGSSSFYGDGDPFGAGGGSEHWSFHMGNLMEMRYVEMRGLSMTPAERQAAVDEFDMNKDSLGPCFEENVFECRHLGMTFGYEDLCHTFKQGHRNVFRLAEKQIERISKFKTGKTVVIAGGTAKHEAVKQKLRQLCEKYGMPPPRFVAEMGVSYSSVKIAQGAAYAASTDLDLETFIQQGAAFGIQRKAVPTYTGKGADKARDWEKLSPVLFSKDKKGALDLDFATGRDEFKLVCDPFFTVQERMQRPDELSGDRCYDVLELGKLKRGNWTVAMSQTQALGFESCVTLQSQWSNCKPRRGGLKQRGSEEPFLDDSGYTSWPLKMVYDCGARCFFFESNLDDTLDIESFLSGASLQDEEPDTTSMQRQQHTQTPQAPAQDDETNGISAQGERVRKIFASLTTKLECCIEEDFPFNPNNWSWLKYGKSHGETKDGTSQGIVSAIDYARRLGFVLEKRPPEEHRSSIGDEQDVLRQLESEFVAQQEIETYEDFGKAERDIEATPASFYGAGPPSNGDYQDEMASDDDLGDEPASQNFFMNRDLLTTAQDAMSRMRGSSFETRPNQEDASRNHFDPRARSEPSPSNSAIFSFEGASVDAGQTPVEVPATHQRRPPPSSLHKRPRSGAALTPRSSQQAEAEASKRRRLRERLRKKDASGISDSEDASDSDESSDSEASG